MNKIESTYTKYDDIINEFTEERINNRFKQLYSEMENFLDTLELKNEKDCFVINEMSLTHLIMDYYSDISRLKKFHKIEKINEIKIKAYETYWLIQRKPIQIVKELDGDKYFHINEKFVLSYITSFLLNKGVEMQAEYYNLKSFNNFLEMLYYYLKYRKCDAQSIELIILSFKAGCLFTQKDTDD